MIKIKYCYIILFFFLFSCANESTPKPKGYPRITKLEAGYSSYDGQSMSFLYPTISKIKEEYPETEGEVWININYPQYDATIYCTYIPITKKTLSKALEDSYQLAYSHAAKATEIKQIQYRNEDRNIAGLIYDIEGSVAVPIQFYVTDSVSSFFRGSVYYNHAVNPDSVAPVTAYLREDIIVLIESLQWKTQSK